MGGQHVGTGSYGKDNGRYISALTTIERHNARSKSGDGVSGKAHPLADMLVRELSDNHSVTLT